MTIKAQIAQVPVGNFTIQGLMSEKKEFGVAVPQLVELNLVPPNRSLKQLEALTGADLQSHGVQKWQTVINPKAVNVISLEQFQLIVRALDKKGNPIASAFVDAMLGLSLHQLFSDAFGQKFEAEDRQRWLQARFNVRHDFRPLTDQLQRYGFKEPWEYAKYVSTMQAKIGLPNGTRDMADFDTLNKLERIQTKLTAYMECGVEPYQAINKLP